MLRRVSSTLIGLVRSPSTESAPNPECSTPASPSSPAVSATPSPPPQSRPFTLSRRLSNFWYSRRVFSAPASSSPLKDNAATALPHVLIPGSLEIDREGVLRITLGAPDSQERKANAVQETEGAGSAVPVPEGAPAGSSLCHQTLRSDKSISSLIKKLELTFSRADDDLLKQELAEWVKTLSTGSFNQVEAIQISALKAAPKAVEVDESMDDETAEDDPSKLIPDPTDLPNTVDISALLEAIAPMESIKVLSLDRVDIKEESAAVALAGTKTLTTLNISNCPHGVLNSLVTYLPGLSSISIVSDHGKDTSDYVSLLVPLKSTLSSISITTSGKKAPVHEFISALEGAPLTHIAVDFSTDQEDVVVELRTAFPAYADAVDKVQKEREEQTKLDDSMDSEATTKPEKECDMDVDGEPGVPQKPTSPMASPGGKVLTRVALFEMKKEELKLSEKIGKDKGSKGVGSLNRKIGHPKR